MNTSIRPGEPNALAPTPAAPTRASKREMAEKILSHPSVPFIWVLLAVALLLLVFALPKAQAHGESNFYKNVVTCVVRSQDIQADATLRATAPGHRGSSIRMTPDQSRTDASDIWVTLPGPISAIGNVASKEDAMGLSQKRFYRVMVLP